MELGLAWGWEMPQPFYDYVSVLAKPQATPLLTVIQHSQPAKRSA
jgi:hypothetical protein